MGKIFDDWVDDPNSADIAAQLNEKRALVCEHDFSVCNMRCGVRLGRNGWKAIPKEQRLHWKEHLFD